MARKPSAKATAAVAAISLSTVIGFGLEGGRVDAKAVGDLIEKGFIETDGNGPAEDGTILVRATDAGRASVAELEETAPVTTTASVSLPFAVASFQPPKSKPRATRKTKYPFEALAVGQAFFVPASEEMPEPAKSLASSVATANARFSEPTGEKEIKQRRVFARDENGEIVIGPDGKRVVAELVDEEVDVTRPVRKFGLAEVADGGEQFGPQFAGISGAAVYRSL